MTFHIPSPKLSACGIEYRFKAAVPLPRFLRAVDQEESEKADKAADESEPNEEVETVDVTIVSSILGNLVHPIQKAKVDYADGAQEDREVCSNHIGPEFPLINSRFDYRLFWQAII